MMKDIRSIVCFTLSEMNEKLGNIELSEYLFNFNSNNKHSSAPEITVISYLMSYFRPLKFSKIAGTNVTINGTHGNFVVNFQLQAKIFNPKYKRTLSCDLVITLFDSNNNAIAKIGIEYDGHSEHINSYGILNDKRKDLSVLKQTGMMRLRIQPEMFQNDEEKKDVYRAVKKYFEQYIKLIPRKKRGTKYIRTYIECPLCKGVQILGANSCPVCLGDGSVKRNVYLGLDIEMFDTFDCPDCSKRTIKNCLKCRGTGFLNRDEAIKIRMQELKIN
ncbi:hypothetical protein J8813_14160 [Klebsiella pneumoniae]